VYAGLAGLYIIEDAEKEAAFESVGLVDNTIDVGLAFADKVFSLDESDHLALLHFPTGATDVDGGGLPQNSILPEMFGHVMTVNGKIYPYLEVDPNVYYHFRLLNACDSRFLRLYFELSTGVRLDFAIIGSDQGLLESPEVVNEVFFGPAERYEIIVTFSGLQEGETVTLMNSEITLLGPVVPGVDDQFMQFKAKVGTGDSAPPPFSSPPVVADFFANWDAPYDDIFQGLINTTHHTVVNDNILDDYIGKRELWITEGNQVLAPFDSRSGGRPLPMLGSRQAPFGLFYEQEITERMIQDKPFVWELINLSADLHVIHLHQIKFKILDRQAVGLSYNTFQYPTGFYRQYPKDSEEPAPYEAGPKDTFISYPGSVTRIAMIFDIPGTYVS